jgi:hypothetical protein
LLAVYTGSTVSNLVLVASADDADNTVASELTFQVVAGTEYQIAVDGFGRNCGTIVLSLVTEQPRFCLPLEKVGNEVRLCLAGLTGNTYTVEASPDLMN